MERDKFEDSERFVARHYRHDAFRAERALRRLGFVASPWRRWRVAAAVAVGIALTGTAAWMLSRPESAPVCEPVATEQENAFTAVRAVEFENAPLIEVAEGIRDTYGVNISGLPDNAAELRLTLRFEGNVEDLIEAINDILGTSITVDR